jgi:hypothetical protein
MESVFVAVQVPGGVKVSEPALAVDVEATSTGGAAEVASVGLETAGVVVELTKGRVFSMYEPLGCIA